MQTDTQPNIGCPVEKKLVGLDLDKLQLCMSGEGERMESKGHLKN